ncbi:hypothetical protein, partial [Thermogutta sp.]|uniref:hypothetical protein n=1 Tax=Thermogutta sp. TaxID=1962930 RepID=UPI00321F83A6
GERGHALIHICSFADLFDVGIHFAEQLPNAARKILWHILCQSDKRIQTGGLLLPECVKRFGAALLV